MDRFLARLERRLGFLAVENVTMIIVGGTAMVLLLTLFRPEFRGLLELDLMRVRQGQVWRLVTYLFLPISMSPFTMFFVLSLFWTMGSSLEGEWGPFKLNLYLLLGMIGTTVAAWLTGGTAGNLWVLASVNLAFATLFPDFQLLLLFFIPVKVKWIGWATAAGLAYAAITGGLAMRMGILAAMANYFLFFGAHLLALARGGSAGVRRREVAPVREKDAAREKPKGAMGARVCAICGAEEADGADIRVCSCAKCGGVTRTLCLEHARNH